jgi:hypothetical protein
MKGSRRMNLPANAVVEELLCLLALGDKLTRFHFLRVVAGLHNPDVSSVISSLYRKQVKQTHI